MFNLLVGLEDGELLDGDRILEGMDVEARARLGVEGEYFDALRQWPVLVMPEVGPDGALGVAQVGDLLGIIPAAGGRFLVRVRVNERIEPIPAVDIWEHRHWFGVSPDPWSLHRTRLTVQDVDLGLTLMELQAAPEVVRPSRRYLRFPGGPVDPNLVVVMMPFEDSLKPVWEKLQRVVTAEGMRCERADTVFQKDSIIDDVVSLLWRARVVISDFTGKNPNVFYETGVAHTLGRRCIPITQSMADVPFDVHHLRALTYDLSEVKMQQLGLNVADRVRTILAES